MRLVNNWSLLSNPVNRMLSLFAFSCKTICHIATKYFSREGMKSIIRSDVVDQTYVYQSILHCLHYGVKFVIIAWGYNQLFLNSVFNCLFIYFFRFFQMAPLCPQSLLRTCTKPLFKRWGNQCYARATSPSQSPMKTLNPGCSSIRVSLTSIQQCSKTWERMDVHLPRPQQHTVGLDLQCRPRQRHVCLALLLYMGLR